MTWKITPRGTKPEGDGVPNMLEAALEHLRAGRSVIPICSPLPGGVGCHQHGKACHGPGKTPLTKWKQYQTVLPTEAEVRLWFETWPTMNIGMATGAVSNTVVADADSDAAVKFALEQGDGELEGAPMVTTGKGAHWYLEHPGEPVKNFAHKWPGLDFRGDGGYVVLPPSLHRSGARYAWHASPEVMGTCAVPPWLMDALRGKKASSSTDSAEGHEGIDFDHFVDGVGEGQRNDLLFRLACKLRGQDIDLDLAKLAVLGAAERCNPPYDHDEALAIVDRVWETYDPTPPNPYFVDDEEDDTPVADEEQAEEPDDPDAYPIEHVSEVIRRLEMDEEQWLVEGIIGKGQCHWFYSDPGTGKSLVGIKLGLHIAAGLACGERDVEQGSVLFISEDSSLVDFTSYIVRVAAGLGLDLSELPVFINSTEGLRITDKKGRAKVERAIGQYDPAFVLFDSCERLVPSDSFASSELDELVVLIQKCRAARRSVVVIDHTNKGGKGEGQASAKASLDILYGGRTKSSTTDHALHFRGNLNEEGVRAVWTKNRGRPRVPFEVTLQADDDEMLLELRPINSAKKLTSTEKKLLDILELAPGDPRGIAELMKRANVPERSAKRALVSLRQKGHVMRELVPNGNAGGHTVTYRTPRPDEIVLGTAADDDEDDE